MNWINFKKLMSQPISACMFEGILRDFDQESSYMVAAKIFELQKLDFFDSNQLDRQSTVLEKMSTLVQGSNFDSRVKSALIHSLSDLLSHCVSPWIMDKIILNFLETEGVAIEFKDQVSHLLVKRLSHERLIEFALRYTSYDSFSEVTRAILMEMIQRLNDKENDLISRKMLAIVLCDFLLKSKSKEIDKQLSGVMFERICDDLEDGGLITTITSCRKSLPAGKI